MKTKKVLKIFFGLLGGLVLAILLTVLFWLGPTLKLVAQTIGPKALGVPVKIERLSINPRKGTIQLSDLSIANPDVFGQSNAVSIASLDIAIDMGSIFTKTVVVHQVRINGPHFTYEQNPSTDNISEFLASIRSFADIDPSAPPEKEKPKKKKSNRKEPKKVIVESLQINDVQVRLANTHDSKLDVGAGLGQFSVSMTNGTVRLDDLYVGNPGRLTSTNLFTLDEMEIRMEPGSIYSSNVVIDAVSIGHPRFFVEQTAETDTFAELLKIATLLTAKIPTNPPPDTTAETIAAETQPETPVAPPPTVTLKGFQMVGLQLNLLDGEDPELNVRLQMDRLSFAPETGNLVLTNLYLTNPKRLQSPNLLALDSLSVEIAPESLGGDTLVVKDITLRKPYATLELNKQTDTTTEFLKIAKGFIERAPGYPRPALPQAARSAQQEQPQPAPENPDAPPPFELHNLLIDDIQIQLLDTTASNNVPEAASMLAGIASLSLKLNDGTMQLKEILVPNLEGFAASNMFRIANIDLSLDPASIHSGQVVINDIYINAPTLEMEQTETSGNIAQLQTALMKFVPDVSRRPKLPEQAGGPSSKPTETAEPIPPAEQPVVLHALHVNNLAIHLKRPPETNAAPTGAFSMGKEGLSKLNPMNIIPESLGGTGADGSETNTPPALFAFDLLSIEPLQGNLSITNLHLSNPPGFSRKNLVQLDLLELALDPDSLQSDALLIKQISIRKPRIRYERQIMTDNLKALQKAIEQATMQQEETADQTAPAAAEGTTPETAETEGQKVVIELFELSGGMVSAKLSIAPAIPIPLPPIRLRDIGKEKGGATIKEASTKMYDAVYDEIIGAIGSTTGIAGDMLKGAGALSFDAAGNLLGGAGDTIGNIFGNSTDDAEDDTANAEDADDGDPQEKTIKRRGAAGRRSPLFR
ncbi:hypothetical protein [Pontiella sp.]|uniref:DUF748 domain-containing protein n=1 Tax=Pontiella sp. TaxID=2837462 RepID=UPI0035671FE7